MATELFSAYSVSVAANLLLLAQTAIGVRVDLAFPTAAPLSFPRVHSALSSIPGFACLLLLEFNQPDKTGSPFLMFLLLLASTVVSVRRIVQSRGMVMSSTFVVAITLVFYGVYEFRSAPWIRPFGIGAHSVLDILLGLDLNRYLGEITPELQLPGTNSVVLALQTGFQVVCLVGGWHRKGGSFSAIAGAGLLACVLLWAMPAVTWARRRRQGVGQTATTVAADKKGK